MKRYVVAVSYLSEGKASPIIDYAGSYDSVDDAVAAASQKLGRLGLLYPNKCVWEVYDTSTGAAVQQSDPK